MVNNTYFGELNTLTLYVGDHCPLCEEAKRLIYPLLGSNWQLQEVNISNDQALVERYGLSIPVLVTCAGEEKGWPFTPGQIKRLLKQ